MDNGGILKQVSLVHGLGSVEGLDGFKAAARSVGFHLLVG